MRRSRIFGWAEFVFLGAGGGSLAFCGGILLYSTFFQLRSEKEFESLIVQNSTRPKVESHADRFAPLGRLEIPAVGLKVIVFEGTDCWTLIRAAGHIPGTALPGDPGGNIGIAAHRDTFFKALKDLGPRDEIILRTVTATFHYRVESKRVVTPEEVSVLNGSVDPSLTLVTCYPFEFLGRAPKRFIVRAHRE